ncbi:PREDICTED: uncharacterized protein LOC104812352 [Tarenaya hassleriana]|uniref:uncharacterized protein LOC104812352 n=1 Tax=Tarenaya hassleriana TaxID=28532 RepID=UPI00053C3BE7|nr:PREDICTED: uncharacterized protein LOC104812352 [Tarenaya hassleriana]
MASACVNNVGVSPEFPACGWFNPRASLSGGEDARSSADGLEMEVSKKTVEELQESAGDFEFRLEDPVTILPADELFSDGKFVPLQLPWSCSKQQQPSNAMRSPENEKFRSMEVSGTDHCLFSPKAPRCSGRWREILGLKRFCQNSKTTSSVSSSSSLPSNARSSSSSLRQFLHRSSRSSSGSSDDASSLSLPLLKDSDCESLSISSSRLSLSSSSSGHEHEDLPRLSLDAERPNHHNMNLNPNLSPNPFAPARSLHPNPPQMRLLKPRDGNHAVTGVGRVGRSPMRCSTGETSGTVMSRAVSVDSPRLNSSGKIVFQSLERSSSSPSSFNGGTSGYRHRPSTERFYSANVRVTPVLNVPVCSLRQFFSSSSSANSSQQHHRNGGNSRASHHHHQHQHGIVKNRNSTDRL